MFNKIMEAIPAKIPELSPKRSDFFMFFILKVHNADIKIRIDAENNSDYFFIFMDLVFMKGILQVNLTCWRC